MVDDDRQGRIHSLSTDAANLERQVCVLEVRRREFLAEAADPLPSIPVNSDRGTAQVVGLTRVREFRTIGVLPTSVVPGITARPNDAASILKPTIGIQQLRTDQADIREVAEDEKSSRQAIAPRVRCRCSRR